jgi:hypothetical protein
VDDCDRGRPPGRENSASGGGWGDQRFCHPKRSQFAVATLPSPRQLKRELAVISRRSLLANSAGAGRDGNGWPDWRVYRQPNFALSYSYSRDGGGVSSVNFNYAIKLLSGFSFPGRWLKLPSRLRITSYPIMGVD